MYNFFRCKLTAFWSLHTATNKSAIAKAGGIKPLITLAENGSDGVQIEAIAALANLAVNGAITFICIIVDLNVCAVALKVEADLRYSFEFSIMRTFQFFIAKSKIATIDRSKTY